MALVIETGAGFPNAQSYVDVETLKAYAKARGETLPTGESALDALLLRAMDFLYGLDFIGTRCTKEQALDWPRYDVMIDGFGYLQTELPRELIFAQCALAIEASKADLMPTIVANAPGPKISQSVGPISIAYANPGRVNRLPAVSKAQALLGKIIRHGGLSVIRT